VRVVVVGPGSLANQLLRAQIDTRSAGASW